MIHYSKQEKSAIEFAEICGWKQIEGSAVCWGRNGEIKTISTLVSDINDWNVIHEFEKTADYGYWNKLAEITGAVDAEHFAKACGRIANATIQERIDAQIWAVNNPEE